MVVGERFSPVVTPQQRLPTVALVLATSLAAAFASPCGGQPATPQRPFTGTVEVPIVNLEVFVTDPKGRPMAGLEADDFEVFEDGRAVTITHFWAAPRVASPTAQQPATTEGPAAAPPQDEPPPERELNLAVLVDHTNHDPQRERSALAFLEQFLSARVPPHTRVMLLGFDGAIRVCQPLTRDPAELEAGLDRCRVRTRSRLDLAFEKSLMNRRIAQVAARELPPNDPHRGDWEREVLGLYEQIEHEFDEVARDQTRAALEGLRRAVELVSDLPGRKAVLFVSDGIDPRATESMFLAWRTSFNRVRLSAVTRQLRQALDRAMPRSSGYPHASLELRELVASASSHRVSLYSLTSMSERLARERSAEIAGAASIETSFADMSEEMILFSLARLTGGRTMVQGPALPDDLAVLAHEPLAGYSLAFAPGHAADQRYHTIRVSVRREGARLRYRRGYRDTRGEDRLVAKTLAAAVVGATDNPLGLTVASLGHERRDDGTIVVDLLARVPISGLLLLPGRGGVYEGKASLCLVVLDADDRLSTVHREPFPLKVPADQIDEARRHEAGFRKALGLRHGARAIAVGLRDETAALDATARLELDLPPAEK